MCVGLAEKSTLKLAGLLFAFGCFTTVMLSYPSITKWWQQMNDSAPMVGRDTHHYSRNYIMYAPTGTIIGLHREPKNCADILLKI